jgi:hypothetical protein
MKSSYRGFLHESIAWISFKCEFDFRNEISTLNLELTSIVVGKKKQIPRVLMNESVSFSLFQGSFARDVQQLSTHRKQSYEGKFKVAFSTH